MAGCAACLFAATGILYAGALFSFLLPNGSLTFGADAGLLLLVGLGKRSKTRHWVVVISCKIIGSEALEIKDVEYVQ